jgi:hypothetical protein
MSSSEQSPWALQRPNLRKSKSQGDNSGSRRHHPHMEQSRQKLSELLHGNALPPPPRKRALIFATTAAIIGAIACGMAAYTHNYDLSNFTWCCGVLVGLAIIRARGYGKPLMIAASALTLSSILGAYFFAFYLTVFSWCTEQLHTDFTYASTAWQELAAPTDEQVSEFAGKWNFPYATREEFDHSYGKALAWFAQTKPTLTEWRDWELANSSFGDYLQSTTDATDIGAAVAAMLAAMGFVFVRTSRLEHRAKQQAIAQRRQ